MRRLVALLVLALSLVMASGPAFAVPAANCPMAGSSMPMDHSQDHNCCKPACAPNCATLCPGAVMPSLARAKAPAEPISTQLVISGQAELHSIDLSGADPPPRTIFS